MSLIVTPGESEVDRYDCSKSANTESDIDHDLDLQPPSPHISPECLDDHTVRHSKASTIVNGSQAKVTSWLQYNNDSTSGNQRVHADDDSTPNLTSVTTGAIPDATVDPESAGELEGESEKRLSSTNSTEQTRQTIDSSNEEQPSDSAATSVTPWGTPKVSPIRSTQGIQPNRPVSPSGISDFSLNPSRYTPSICPSIHDQNSQRINPKKARLKHGINRFDGPTLSRIRTTLGTPSSVALGKRPVGYYGIGEHRGGFPPDVADLASYEPRSSTPNQKSSMPARTDSKTHASLLFAGRTSQSKLNASFTSSKPDLRSKASPTQEISSLACEASQSSTISLHSRSSSNVQPFKGKASVARQKVTVVGDELSECAELIPVPEYGAHFKTGKRESLPAAFCAVAPSSLGRYGDATHITTMSTTSNPADHYVPLSDACPLIVGSLAMRQKLCVQGIDPEDPKVHNILKQHDIAIERVSKSDQILLWHLAIHDESRSLAKTTSNEQFSHAIHWKGAGQSYSEVDLTLKVFLKWLKEKEQAHAKLYQREQKGLASRSPPDLVRWAGKRDKYDDQAITLSRALPLPHEPAAVWLNIYRLLRCHGISEEQLDREQVMTLMSKPRHERRKYLDTVAPSCRAKTIDNAELDRRPKRHGSITHTQTVPTMRIRSSSYSWEAEDKILDLPVVKKYLRRGRSGRRSYSVINSDKRTRPLGDSVSDWDTPLAKLPLNKKDRLPKPLLSDIELPRNYVPPDRRKEGEDELLPSRVVSDGLEDLKDVATCGLERRGSEISRFSRDTTESEREGRTGWGRFRRGVRRCLPPCCCG